MKSFSLLFLHLICVAAFVTVTQASYCSCDLTMKEQICGSNGITYKNVCEFECTQRDYKRLGRILNKAKAGPC
ncbi:uncharacterized protein [Eurosta solidaginis]|uniref:uncharacterized protein n=1 Tax=Eurosta solidaginis TaxID=178769 RepID=UPI003530ED19